MTKQTSYKRYVGEENFQRLQESDPEIVEGEERELSIMLADVRSFTNYSESHEPTEIIEILNDYFDPLVRTIFEFGGSVDKYMGDCIMAIFGAPVPGISPKYQGHALTAVKTAVECQKWIRAYSKERDQAGQDTLKIGYTINSGLAVAGHFGAEERQDYSVIGDMVNTCARIEKFVEEDSILVGQDTYTRVRNRVRAKKKPSTRVKGKDQLVHIYEILRLNRQDPDQS